MIRLSKGAGFRRRLCMRYRPNAFRPLALVCLILNGCSANGAVNTPSPLPIAKVAATPIQGKTSIVAVPASPVGNVQPVYVSIANGTGSPMLESSGEIFALGADGNRVPALPPQVSDAYPLRPEFPKALERYTNGGVPVK